jgi:hypothetical protein
MSTGSVNTWHPCDSSTRRSCHVMSCILLLPVHQLSVDMKCVRMLQIEVRDTFISSPIPKQIHSSDFSIILCFLCLVVTFFCRAMSRRDPRYENSAPTGDSVPKWRNEDTRCNRTDWLYVLYVFHAISMAAILTWSFYFGGRLLKKAWKQVLRKMFGRKSWKVTEGGENFVLKSLMIFSFHQVCI